MGLRYKWYCGVRSAFFEPLPRPFRTSFPCARTRLQTLGGPALAYLSGPDTHQSKTWVHPHPGPPHGRSALSASPSSHLRCTGPVYFPVPLFGGTKARAAVLSTFGTRCRWWSFRCRLVFLPVQRAYFLLLICWRCRKFQFPGLFVPLYPDL